MNTTSRETARAAPSDPFLRALDEAHANGFDTGDSRKWAHEVRTRERQYEREQRIAAAAEKPHRGLLSRLLPHSS